MLYWLNGLRGSLVLNEDTEPHPEMCRLAEVRGLGLFPQRWFRVVQGLTLVKDNLHPPLALMTNGE